MISDEKGEKMNKKSAISLPELEEQFHAVINSVQNGIMAVDCQGILTLVNKMAEEILGIKREELIGRFVVEVYPETLLLGILESKKPLLGQKLIVNGTVVMANYAPIMVNGKMNGAVSVFQDISVMENTSKELNYVKSLSKELEAIINSSYDGMFITDGQGNVLRLNSAYERITGIKAVEVLGRNMQKLVEENYYDQSVTLRVMNEHRVITLNQIVRGDQKILVTGNPVFNEQGELVRVVTNVRDVTELVALQEQLVETRAQTLKYKTELSHLRLLQLGADDIIYRSPIMERAIELALKVADVDSTVLITGDSGTGKEVIAKLIHKKGLGLTRPFIKINCAAIPEQLLESELFGYVGGAFTGAKKEGKPGMFELAHNGTLFLDEIGDLPLMLQAKILRALQEKAIMRVGGTKSIDVNVRIISATNRNLAEMVKTGQFRQDLYYRLMVVPIHLPPLCERKEDIPLLIRTFCDRFNKRFRFEKKLSAALIDRLVEYSWPGNVRELENLLERMIVTASTDLISVEQLPEYVNQKMTFIPPKGGKLKNSVELVEAHLLAEAFKEHLSWQRVAEVLGVDKSTIFRKAARYGLINK